MNCTLCGNAINSPKLDQKCCIVCQYEVKRIKSKKKPIAKKKKYLRECRTCSKEFQSEYKVEKFCSTDCRNHLSDHKINALWIENPLPKKHPKNSFNKFQSKRANEQRGEL